MAARIARPPITAEKFSRMDTEGYELVDGRLEGKATGAKASWVQRLLGQLLGVWAAEGGYGDLFDAECGYACFRANRVRKPDVSFGRSGRLPGGGLPEGDIPVPPDLAVEVVSPQEKAYKLADKIGDYDAVQVPLIWVIYPNRRSVQVRMPGGIFRELSDADELTGGPVLPRFRVRVADLFPLQPPAQP